MDTVLPQSAAADGAVMRGWKRDVIWSPASLGRERTRPDGRRPGRYVLSVGAVNGLSPANEKQARAMPGPVRAAEGRREPRPNRVGDVLRGGGRRCRRVGRRLLDAADQLR